MHPAPPPLDARTAIAALSRAPVQTASATTVFETDQALITRKSCTLSLHQCCCARRGVVSAHKPHSEAKGRRLSVHHELALVLLEEALRQTLTADNAQGLSEVVSVPVVEPAEIVSLVGCSDTLVTAGNHVGFVHRARIQDVEYKDIVVDGDDVDVHGSFRQLIPEVGQAAIHLPGTWRQTRATVSHRAGRTARRRASLSHRCCTGSCIIATYQPDSV